MKATRCDELYIHHIGSFASVLCLAVAQELKSYAADNKTPSLEAVLFFCESLQWEQVVERGKSPACNSGLF